MTPLCLTVLLVALALLCCLVNQGLARGLGIFENQSEVGAGALRGHTVFDPATGAYLITGGGENMWSTNDAFHFVWTKVSGDLALSATIHWPTNGGNAHRKACLLVRQGLEANAVYVDAALHGDGLLSLQFRDTAGGLTHEIQANPLVVAQAMGQATSATGAGAAAKEPPGPIGIGLERQADTFFLKLGPASGTGSDDHTALAASGSFIRLRLTDPVYVGLGVCAHDDRVTEQARFAQVELTHPQRGAEVKPVLHCTLETVPIASKDRRAIYHTLDHIEAPNWSRDGKYFLFNANGRIQRLPVAGGQPEAIETGSCTRCNNDHGFSPDGAMLAISDQSQDGGSRIYTLPAAGGAPKLITPLAPSYWHGWSPDGSTLAYCAERNGEFDIYTISAQGGQETRLTSTPGLDDGPDYTPDGRFIYFNSERTGSMQIWRMRADGSQQEQLTSDSFNNWFPHPSPDGKWLLFLSYDPGIKGHPANEMVSLRLMPLAGGPIQDLARLFGGQGTINVPSWSPDSRQLAFVSYELLRP